MRWKQYLWTGLGGGVCLAFVRLIRDAATNKVTLDALGTACLAAIPLCAVAIIVVFVYRPKTLKEAFTTALLAPSMLISIIAGSGGGDSAAGAAGERSGQIGARSVYEASALAEAISFFTIPEAHAQQPERVRQIKPEQFKPGVWSRTLRFLGMSQESTDWIYVLRQTPDLASAESMLRSLAEQIDTTGLGLQVVHPEAMNRYYIVAGSFGARSQALMRQQSVEAALARSAKSAPDTTAVELLSLLKDAGLTTGRVMSAE
jgi:hypothetical protein